MNNLKCPFCGADGHVKASMITCSNIVCSLSGRYMPPEQWNNRMGDNSKEAFRQFQESLAAVMAEIGKLKKNQYANDAQELLAHAVKFRHTKLILGPINNQTTVDGLNLLADLSHEYARNHGY